jgi:hypothetical protein
LVSLSIANANYEFIYCKIGTNGHISDGGLIENTKCCEKSIDDRILGKCLYILLICGVLRPAREGKEIKNGGGNREPGMKGQDMRVQL